MRLERRRCSVDRAPGVRRSSDTTGASHTSSARFRSRAPTPTGPQCQTTGLSPRRPRLGVGLTSRFTPRMRRALVPSASARVTASQRGEMVYFTPWGLTRWLTGHHAASVLSPPVRRMGCWFGARLRSNCSNAGLIASLARRAVTAGYSLAAADRRRPGRHRARDVHEYVGAEHAGTGPSSSRSTPTVPAIRPPASPSPTNADNASPRRTHRLRQARPRSVTSPSTDHRPAGVTVDRLGAALTRPRASHRTSIVKKSRLYGVRKKPGTLFWPGMTGTGVRGPTPRGGRRGSRRPTRG